MKFKSRKPSSRLPGRIILVLALVPVLLVPLIRWEVEATPPAKPATPPAVVGVASAVTTELAPVHWAPGSVISRRDAKVASEQDGRVVRVAEVGQKVRAGEPLMTLLTDTPEKFARAKEALEHAVVIAPLGSRPAQQLIIDRIA